MSRAGLAEAFANLSLSVLYCAFAYAQARSFIATPRASLLLLVVLETLFATFFVLRRHPVARATSTVAWISTTLGTLLPLLLRPTADPSDFIAGEVVQIAGTSFGIAAIISLNRSLGLLPANRGIRAGGAYAIVRHPVYASYLVSHLGYIASNFSAWNVGVATVALGAQLIRIRREEQLLSRDPDYIAYRDRTRWRLLPFVY